MQKIQNSKICVVGLGGVGSHTAVMLARGGVEYMRLIDFDQVTLSSLNRHACATLQDVGIPKVTCVKEFCHQLGVSNIDARVEMYTKASGPALLEGQNWDLVIDCIDDVPTKAALLAYCLQHNIQVFSCMGAGGKSDITRLHISDLRTSSRDPLASKLRQTMKRTLKEFNAEVTAAVTSSSSSSNEGSNAVIIDDSYLDDMDRLTIIFSSEKSVIKLADLTDEQKQEADKNQFGAVDGMRIRVLPVLGPIPAVMGQSLAAMAMCEIGDKPMAQPVTGERVGRNTRNKMLQHLMRREEQIANGTLVAQGGESNTTNMWTGPLEVDSDDMEYMLGVWRNRCAVTGARLGTVLDLVRWDLSKPTTCGNLVLMSTHALKKYDLQGRESIPLEIQRRIEKRLATCRDLNSEIF
jgi:tRNA threonylcarbamoyladenosine dehydratase